MPVALDRQDRKSHLAEQKAFQKAKRKEIARKRRERNEQHDEDERVQSLTLEIDAMDV